MREILFRAKSKIKGNWHYGYLAKGYNTFYISDGESDSIAIDPETVGQFAGLTDKNGKKIFEGDLIVYDYDEPDIDGSLHTVPNEVRYDAEIASFLAVEKYSGNEDYTSLDGLPWRVIGNIYDNPELLEVKDNV